MSTDNRNTAEENKFVTIEGYRDEFYKIADYDKMDPFFMTLTSPEDHWIYISSTGGLTAGRKNSDNALFPYYTDDKVSENYLNTGSKTIIQIEKKGAQLWEPFSPYYRGIYAVKRNLYKNCCGNILVFEEINNDLGLTFTTSWSSSPKYGIVKESRLINQSGERLTLSVLDGVQNILPAQVPEQIQVQMSNLLNAYKRSELVQDSGPALFSLTATLTDLAEPSECLRANSYWSAGFDPDVILLSSRQLDNFRDGKAIMTETDIKGERGACFVQKDIVLDSESESSWVMCGEVNQTHESVSTLIDLLKNEKNNLLQMVRDDVNQATVLLQKIIGINDGLQQTGNKLTTVHHSANVLFNVMRGGYFHNGYSIMVDDLVDFVKEQNSEVFEHHNSLFSENVSERLFTDVLDDARSSGDVDLIRLVSEYLPITFSRRHGDPSRPWNKFSINTRNEDGSARIDYQGNWRDIFQNWEALLVSNPLFVEDVICKFLNATTADGYNPYRISRNGIDWERPEHDNPWANIGYWSDHQIIYLQKLLELQQNYYPGATLSLFNEPLFVHANVPYEIKKFEAVFDNPCDTIVFNEQKDRKITERVEKIGSDGRLLTDSTGNIVHTTMLDKLILLLLAKMSNLVPDGGIWMTTQRPEWNDANNALVGKGLSVVTLAYLYRFVSFLVDLVASDSDRKYTVNSSTLRWFSTESEILQKYLKHLEIGFDDKIRFSFIKESVKAADSYREVLYKAGLFDDTEAVSHDQLKSFLTVVSDYISNSLKNNIRPDGLFHSYNTLAISEGSATVSYLYEMLEGQVAGISSGILSAQQANEIFAALRESSMYRADQNSYMLYPNRELDGFLEKNSISEEDLKKQSFFAKLRDGQLSDILIQDKFGVWHFHYTFRNANELAGAIKLHNNQNSASEITQKESAALLQLFESVFNHTAFTGRSGTFYAYEGLGSIYWHMVSKLLLASQEALFNAKGEDSLKERLRNHYYQVRDGIGFNKSPEVYGAFPTDPYSHTPFGAGAKQPGMTGQVKEEVITRFAEMGLRVLNGEICFDSMLVHEDEYLKEKANFKFYDVNKQEASLELEPGSYAFTFCQVPVVVRNKSVSNDEIQIVAIKSDGTRNDIAGASLGKEISKAIFAKTGVYSRIEINL
jgi:hypothetical protein